MRKPVISLLFPVLVVIITILHGCAAMEKVSDRSGVQLWSENCQRCHAVPPPAAYNDYRWESITTHMRVRANLTETEENKILEFLKSSNGMED